MTRKSKQRPVRSREIRNRWERYPYCAGSFDNCTYIEIKDPHNPPEVCRKCPVYTESRYYNTSRKIEVSDFMRSVFSK